MKYSVNIIEKTLGELSIDNKGSYGIAASAVDYNKDLYTYLRITDINDDGTLNYSEFKSVDDENAYKYLLKENDIVFARTGNSTGRSYFYDRRDGEFVYAGFLIKFSLNPLLINPWYMKYYTQSKIYKDWVQSFNTGSTRGNINAQTYAKMPVPLPTREVQDKLVYILNLIDDKMKMNNRLNDNLTELIETLFEKWFLKFEFPSHNELDYKSAGGKLLESDLGKIPEHWNVIAMGQFLEERKERVEDREIIEYSTTNKGIQLRDDKFNKQLSKSKSKNKVMRKGDIVFGMSRQILNFGIMKDEIGAVSSAYNIFQIDKSTFLPEVLELYMRKQPNKFIDLIKPAAREGQGIDKQYLMKKTVVVPSIMVQRRFFEVYSTISSTINKIKDETEKLTNIRDTLLPKLISGEIGLEDVWSMI